MNIIEKIAIEKLETHLSNSISETNQMDVFVNTLTGNPSPKNTLNNYLGKIREQINIATRIAAALKENR